MVIRLLGVNIQELIKLLGPFAKTLRPNVMNNKNKSVALRQTHYADRYTSAVKKNLRTKAVPAIEAMGAAPAASIALISTYEQYGR